MQVIYRWAFAVAPALCPFLPPTLKSGGARAPPEYMAPAPMVISNIITGTYSYSTPGSKYSGGYNKVLYLFVG